MPLHPRVLEWLDFVCLCSLGSTHTRDKVMSARHNRKQNRDWRVTVSRNSLPAWPWHPQRVLTAAPEDVIEKCLPFVSAHHVVSRYRLFLDSVIPHVSPVQFQDQGFNIKIGHQKYYFSKYCAALAAKDCDHAKHYEMLYMEQPKIRDVLLPGTSLRISRSGRELTEVAGLQLSERDLINARGYTGYADGMHGVRIIIKRAIELIETRRDSKNRALGFLLIGFFTPTLGLAFNKRNLSGRWLCENCFRHSREYTHYCKEHSSEANRKWFTRQMRKKGSILLNDLLLGGPQFTDVGLSISSYSEVRALTTEREWLRDVGLYHPQPPIDWRNRVVIWRNTYPWLRDSVSLTKQQTWTGVVNALRCRLKDAYCCSEDFDIWEAKIRAYDTDVGANRTLRTTLLPSDKRLKKRSMLPDAVNRFRNEGLTKTQAAAKIVSEYGFSESAFWKCLERNQKLQTGWEIGA